MLYHTDVEVERQIKVSLGLAGRCAKIVVKIAVCIENSAPDTYLRSTQGASSAELAGRLGCVSSGCDQMYDAAHPCWIASAWGAQKTPASSHMQAGLDRLCCYTVISHMC